jgi:glutamate synthase (NADPH/NADH) large chain/glutamate synthase (ferredoxin)
MGFSTAPLIATGCIMMRACHLNTCPVGIATQDPELRKRFKGTPEHVVNFFFFVAEEVREILASIGLRSLDEAIGRVDLLRVGPAIDHWKARGVDLTHILTHIEMPDGAVRRRVEPPPAVLEDALDWQLVEGARPALERREPVRLSLPIRNRNRCVGGILSSHVARSHGAEGLPEDSIVVDFEGSAGQSFGGWLAPGINFTLRGDAQDYAGKGLSGGVFAIRPRDGMGDHFRAEQNVIVGNTVLYGATAGKAFFRGLAGERFAVRNSGAWAVVEGVGDHCCEYMTGGRVVVLGSTGRNFAAGMSGGVAYVLDEDGSFPARCNMGMVGFEGISEADALELRTMIEEHGRATGSPVARRVLEDWGGLLAAEAFVKVMPHDYKRVLRELAEEEARAALASENGNLSARRSLDAVGETGA